MKVMMEGLSLDGVMATEGYEVHHHLHMSR